MPRLALVDRDRDSRAICAAVLTHFGHHVSCWDHWPSAAIAAIEQPFDLVLFDPGPITEGLAVLHAKLRAEFPHQPVVIVSGAFAGSSRAPFTVDGAPLLLKPFSVAELIEAVNRTVGSAAD